jgi:hypothetical protein
MLWLPAAPTPTRRARTACQPARDCREHAFQTHAVPGVHAHAHARPSPSTVRGAQMRVARHANAPPPRHHTTPRHTRETSSTLSRHTPLTSRPPAYPPFSHPTPQPLRATGHATQGWDCVECEVVGCVGGGEGRGAHRTREREEQLVSVPGITCEWIRLRRSLKTCDGIQRCTGQARN